MTILDPDEISRIALLHLADGSAASLEDADRLIRTRHLALLPTRGAVDAPEGQAAVLTAAVTAVRTFGAVQVIMTNDSVVRAGVHRGKLLSEALQLEGAHVNGSSAARAALGIVIGTAEKDSHEQQADLVLYVGWDGWTATVSPTPLPTAEGGNVLAAIAAAALAVSEAFAHTRGIAGSDAGYRTAQLNLLGLGRTSVPDLQYGPASWWLVGLGHLGQAYGWVISHLPYDDPAAVEITLQDTDKSSPANHSTSVFTPPRSCGVPKTRLVAVRLEEAGLRTRIIERRLDAEVRLRDDETHTVALIGVDNLASRRVLSAVGWPLAIDMGLGAGVTDHTAISMHRFPGSKQSHEIPAWRDQPVVSRGVPATPGFDDLESRFEQCGVVMLAGKAIGVPFVGMIAACIAVTEALKQLHGMPGSEVVGIDISTGHYESAPAVRHPRIAQTPLRQS